MPASFKTLKERKARYREVIKLLEQGHTMTSAGKLVGLTQPAISRIAKSYGFHRRVKMVEANILGKVKSALVKRAVGQTIIKEYQSLNKSGEIVDLIEKVEIPGDVKAQLAYLQAKDKDGGWDNKSNTVNVQFNQVMQGISTNDLLLTLRSAPEQLSTGGEGGGVLEVSGVREEKLPITPNPISPTYDANYDNFHDAKGKKKTSRSALDTYFDPNNGRLDEPVEGMLDNVGEDEECS
ncbi:MAG TPA: hypothetical protein PLP33_28695 [Leptospiraceae bacterium]|nr:hypothetical protein [Leptospiraceae bacterium]